MEVDPKYHATWGIRWERGYFRIHLMWMHWNTQRWCSSVAVTRKHYQKLETALKQFDGVYGAVMIFPAVVEPEASVRSPAGSSGKQTTCPTCGQKLKQPLKQP